MRILILIFLVINCFKINSQNDSLNLIRDFYTSNQLIKDEKIDSSLIYMHDSVFSIMSKEQIIKGFQMTRNVPNIKMKLFWPSIISIRPIVEFDSKKHSIITYSYLSEMEMAYFDTKANIDDRESKLNNQLESYYKIFGKENVNYDSTRNVFIINAQKKIVATLFQNSSNWKFLVIDKPERLKLAKKFIPEKVFE